MVRVPDGLGPKWSRVPNSPGPKWSQVPNGLGFQMPCPGRACTGRPCPARALPGPRPCPGQVWGSILGLAQNMDPILGLGQKYGPNLGPGGRSLLALGGSLFPLGGSPGWCRILSLNRITLGPCWVSTGPACLALQETLQPLLAEVTPPPPPTPTEGDDAPAQASPSNAP